MESSRSPWPHSLWSHPRENLTRWTTEQVPSSLCRPPPYFLAYARPHYIKAILFFPFGSFLHAFGGIFFLLKNKTYFISFFSAAIEALEKSRHFSVARPFSGGRHYKYDGRSSCRLSFCGVPWPESFPSKEKIRSHHRLLCGRGRFLQLPDRWLSFDWSRMKKCSDAVYRVKHKLETLTSSFDEPSFFLSSNSLAM